MISPPPPKGNPDPLAYDILADVAITYDILADVAITYDILADVAITNDILADVAITYDILADVAITYDILADVADGLERGLAHHLGAAGIGDMLGHGADQLRPQVVHQLRARDVRHTLRRRARPRRLRAKRLQHLHNKENNLFVCWGLTLLLNI